MSEQEYFRNALSDFTYEAASGAAIRHLADLGCTAKQISERLTYPTPYERVQRTLWKHLTDTGVILTEEPGSRRGEQKAAYTVEHGRYGRASFLLRTESSDGDGPVHFRELRYSRDKCGSLAEYLARKCDGSGGGQSYVSCSFGLQRRRDAEQFERSMAVLNDRQREYITGLMWEDKICYHRLDQRMREITVKLYDNGMYDGYFFFLKHGEKVRADRI